MYESCQMFCENRNQKVENVCLDIDMLCLEIVFFDDTWRKVDEVPVNMFLDTSKLQKYDILNKQQTLRTMIHMELNSVLPVQ